MLKFPGSHLIPGMGGVLGGDPILSVPGLLHYSATWYPGLYLDDGADPAADAAQVATVLSRNGSGNNFTQATGIQRPLWDVDGGPNGLPALTFNGSNSAMQMQLAAVLLQPNTVYVVCAADSSSLGGSGRIISGDGDMNNFDFTGGSTNIYSGALVSTALPSVSEWDIWCLVYNGGSSAIYKNGTLVASGNVGTNVTDLLHLGIGYSGGEPFLGRIASLIIADALHDAATRNIVCTELSRRTGIPIA